MSETALVLSIIILIFCIYIFKKLEEEKKRNRILQAFVAWIITSISNYENRLDTIKLLEKNTWIKSPLGKKEHNKNLPINYESILWDVCYELAQDFWTELDSKILKEWIDKDKSLFADENYENCWFNLMYIDLFEKIKQTIKNHKE
jgi:hypothetical protein